jgi:hypothetical protein
VAVSRGWEGVGQGRGELRPGVDGAQVVRLLKQHQLGALSQTAERHARELAVQVGWAFPSCARSISTEILPMPRMFLSKLRMDTPRRIFRLRFYLCHECSCRN